MSQPNPQKIRHRFRYGSSHHFRVGGTNLNQVVQVTVTDGDANWVVEPSTLAIAPDNIEFDATPSKPSGLGGTGSLTITVSNVAVQPPPPTQSGSVTASASYSGG